MWIGRQRQANAVLTLCGFLLAETPVCLRRSDFENPEAARGGVVERSWGWSAGGPGGGAPAGGRALFLASRSCADRGLFPLRLQESCGEAMVAPTPPGTRRRARGVMAPASFSPSPHAPGGWTETGPRFQDKMSLPLSAVAPQTGWSVPGRHHGALFSSVCVSCPSWEQH